MSLNSSLLNAVLILVGGAAAVAAFVFERPEILVGMALISALGFFYVAGKGLNRLADLPPPKRRG